MTQTRKKLTHTSGWSAQIGARLDDVAARPELPGAAASAPTSAPSLSDWDAVWLYDNGRIAPLSISTAASDKRYELFAECVLQF